ncbi:MAG: hypothetical protein ABEJ65_00755, partial [bacterium]
MYRQRPAVARLALLIVGVYSLMYAKYWAWNSPWGWGPRYLVKITPYMLLFVGAFLQSHLNKTIKSTAILVLGTAGAVIQLLSTIVNYQNPLILILRVMNESEMNLAFNPYLSPIQWHWDELLATGTRFHWFWFQKEPLLVVILISLFIYSSAILIYLLWSHVKSMFTLRMYLGMMGGLIVCFLIYQYTMTGEGLLRTSYV